MKKNFLILTIAIIGFNYLQSQTVNGIPLEQIDVDYVQIVGTSKSLSNKVTIDIDFGQHDKFFKSKDTQIIDENGKKLIFNSMIDALNFMSKNGYEFIDANAFVRGGQNVYHFMLKKKS